MILKLNYQRIAAVMVRDDYIVKYTKKMIHKTVRKQIQSLLTNPQIDPFGFFSVRYIIQNKLKKRQKDTL